MFFVLVGVLMLISKSSRLIYIIISFEIMIVGVLMFNFPLWGELNFIVALVFSILSRVVGLLIIVLALNTYGSESVHF